MYIRNQTPAPVRRNFGYFGKSESKNGKGAYTPPPAPPPEDLRPTITPEEEQAILAATLPIPEPEPAFVRRNAVPLFVGGGVLILGILGMILMIRI
jgi:hypothetical protein